MAAAIATLQQGCSSGGQNDDGSSLLLNAIKATFNLDGMDIDTKKSMLDVADITEDDLPPFSFDFEDIWDRVSFELSKEPAEDYSENTSEIIAATKDYAAKQMHLNVTDEDILKGIVDEDILQVSPLVDLKDLMGTLGQVRKGEDIDGPAAKRIKSTGDIKQYPKQSLLPSGGRKSSESSETQFVFVNQISTNQKKVITLRKGEQLPPGYEMASIQGDFSPLPEALASIPSVALKEAILGAASPSSGNSPKSPKASLPGTGSSSSPSKSVETPGTKKGLMSLSDLMTSELKKKEKPRLVYKQRNCNPSKIVSLLNKTSGVASCNTSGIGSNVDMDIVPSDEEYDSGPRIIHLSGADNSLGSKPGIEITKTSKSLPASNNSITITQPTKLGSSTRISASGDRVNDKRGCILFACKLCGHTFPRHSDHMFRRHMLVKHDLEIKDDTYFEENKVYSTVSRRCKKCSKVVLNNFQEHRQRCLPTTPIQDAFEEVDLTANITEFLCGLCMNVFGSRYELKRHCETIHPSVESKMLFDPDFRCAQCLKRFDESTAMGKHCATCTERRPRTETILELAKSLLHCDICLKKHESIDSALACYFDLDLRRCVLCLALFKERSSLINHLSKYHGMDLLSKLLPCPICPGSSPDKIGVISHHLVTEHFAQMLLTSNQGLPMPAPIQKALVKTPKSLPTSTSITAVRKVPELQPLYPNANPNFPPGIVINTTRLNPTAGGLVLHNSGMPSATPIRTAVIPTASRLVRQQTINAGGTIRPQPGTSIVTMNAGGRMILVPVQQGTNGSPSGSMRPATILRSHQGGTMVLRPVHASSGSNLTTVRLPISSVGSPFTMVRPVTAVNSSQARPTNPANVRPLLATQMLPGSNSSTLAIRPAATRPAIITSATTTNAGSGTSTSTANPITRTVYVNGQPLVVQGPKMGIGNQLTSFGGTRQFLMRSSGSTPTGVPQNSGRITLLTQRHATGNISYRVPFPLAPTAPPSSSNTPSTVASTTPSLQQAKNSTSR